MSVPPDGADGMSERGAPVGAAGGDRETSRGSSANAGESHLTMGVYRLLRSWRDLPQERRLAAGAALGLFVALFLPWYQETVIARGLTGLRSISASLTGWQAFSFVEAAVLLVAAATLVLLFVRSEGRAFHVPGGDGGVITAAGLWVCLLIVWRMFDKEGTTGHGQYATTSGIEWGIFVALAVGALLVYAGTQIRLAHEPEPPLPGERREPLSRRGRMSGLKGQRRPKPGPSRGPPSSPATRPPSSPETRPPRLVGARRPRSLLGADPADAPTRGINRSEIANREVAEPPTTRIVRSRKPSRPTTDADDQLTTRLDRTD